MKPTSKKTLRLESDATPGAYPALVLRCRPLDHGRLSEFAFAVGAVPTKYWSQRSSAATHGLPTITHIYPRFCHETPPSQRLLITEVWLFSNPRPLFFYSLCRSSAGCFVQAPSPPPLHPALFACSLGPLSCPSFPVSSSQTRTRPWPTPNHWFPVLYRKTASTESVYY